MFIAGKCKSYPLTYTPVFGERNRYGLKITVTVSVTTTLKTRTVK